jgi:hypothetical protein
MECGPPSVPIFVSGNIPVLESTSYDPGNGVLDVRDGDRIVVVYADRSYGQPDPDKKRTDEASVSCGR